MTREQLEQAGEYVLGLLEPAERAAFEADMAADPALAAAVDRLTQHLQALDDTATPATPRAGLWAAIEAELDAGPKSAAAAPAVVVPLRRRPAGTLWWMATAASVVLALGVGYWAGSLGPETPQPVVVAVLVSEETLTPGAIVEAFADNSIRLTPLEAFEVPEGRVLEVWTLPDAATGPVSLGTLDAPRALNLPGPSLPLPEAGQLYEITLEPAPRSPTGRPTGPILVKGFGRAPLL